MFFTPPLATLRRDGSALVILDQTELPWRLVERRLGTLEDVLEAIVALRVRGAPLIGVAAAHGLALALERDASDSALEAAIARLLATRPTAVNLRLALEAQRNVLAPLPPAERPAAAWAEAERQRRDDAARCEAIGRAGLPWIETLARRLDRPVRILTHCNAGWVATCGAGTALAPVYLARAAGIPLEVFVSETRPRNQGLITHWELTRAGVPATLIADNAAGLLIAQGEIDLVLVGADRIARNGDVANKIGTYLKALAAHAHGVPFLVAAPATTFDPACPNGAAIPIEERAAEEVLTVAGLPPGASDPVPVRLTPLPARTRNPAFDLTPARWITAILTETGAWPAPLAAANTPPPST
ncbi:MAG: S-methyl-5-thioribose-1-phosphate isomerase [Rhodocyclales bacterium]|nr:S-methyl-5-thioribose-1-phosphate isomerase [Rhodocyclales bacterium]